LTSSTPTRSGFAWTAGRALSMETTDVMMA
jgi:hypothetical protein